MHLLLMVLAAPQMIVIEMASVGRKSNKHILEL